MNSISDEVAAAIEDWKMGPGNSSKRIVGEDYMPSKDCMALKSSWHTEPMPFDKSAQIKLGIPIEEEELRQLALGHIPYGMEDHWFMYFDGEFIRYYRSWTGFCCYMAKVERRYGVLSIDFLVVNRDEEQREETNDLKDIITFANLVAAELGLSGGELLLKRMLDHMEERGFVDDGYIEEIEEGGITGDIENLYLYFEGQHCESYDLKISRSPVSGEVDVVYGVFGNPTTFESAYADKWLNPIRNALNRGIKGDCWRYANDGDRFTWGLIVKFDGEEHRVQGENTLPEGIFEVARLLDDFAKDTGLEREGKPLECPLACKGEYVFEIR